MGSGACVPYPPGVLGTEFWQLAASVMNRLETTMRGLILKLSDKVTLTRAFTARKKNRPVIGFL